METGIERKGPDSVPTSSSVDDALLGLVRLLARQAARDWAKNPHRDAAHRAALHRRDRLS